MLDADIVHVAGSDLLPLLLGWLLRRRFVVEHHGFQAACPNGQLMYEPAQTLCIGHYMAGRHFHCLRCNAGRGKLFTLKLWLLTYVRRWCCLQAAANVVPTAWLGTILQLPRTRTIHHGVTANQDTAAESCGGRPSVVFVGRLVTVKGVKVLLEAVNCLRHYEFQLNIIGDGPERARLEGHMRALGLEKHVVFSGSLVGQERERALAGAKAVIVPSISETFGLVVAEGMLRKKVLIVSQVGALTEVIGDAGLAFPTGDAKALAGCLEQVLRSDQFADQLALRAAQRASSLFTPERMVNQHLVLYRQLLNEC
jgi:glycosyltransferase involved in cell wall biosynthesis